MKSPAKEKEQKDAELKPEVPPKDDAVSENPPVLPETATTERSNPEAEAKKIGVNAEAEAREEQAAKDKENEVATPNKEKSGFLSGLPFMKRNRSVSPNTQMKEQSAKSEAEAPKEESSEVAKTEEATTDATAAESTDKSAETTEEPAKTETSTPNKRQSVLGSLGRRASKAMSGMRAPKKENTTPTSEAKMEESTEAEPAADKPTTNGEVKPAESQEQQSIGDVPAEVISVGQPQQQTPTVTASA